MTRFSRVLTVAVTVLAVVFMSVAAVALAVRTDWKAELAKYPSAEVTKQQQQITELDEEIAATERAHTAWIAAVESDIAALTAPATGREAQLESQAKALEEYAHKLSDDIETAARKAQSRLDELNLRREDTVRLQSQYDELVSQTAAAQAEVKRLKDLLVQAEGILLRVRRRNDALRGKASPYEEMAREAEPAADEATAEEPAPEDPATEEPAESEAAPETDQETEAPEETEE